jgi:hypothetical protein
MLPATVASLLILFTDPVAGDSNSANSASAYGSLTGQFVYDGPLLEQQFSTRTRDTAICGTRVPREDLIVDPKTRGIRYVAVFLRKRPRELHPDLKDPPATKVNVRLDKCRLSPRLIIAETRQPIEVRWKDQVVHSLLISSIRNVVSCKVVAVNGSNGRESMDEFSFRRTEPVPIPISCSIHPIEKGHWLIVDHPYHAVTDAEGRFRIDNLPAGEHEFRTWHERPGWIQKSLKVVIRGGQVTDIGKSLVAARRFEPARIPTKSGTTSR